MKFKDFKNAVIAYAAAKGMMKEKQIKKIIKFECKKKEASKPYWAYFKYAGKNMKLKYISTHWYLFIEKTNAVTFLKTGLTINDCCDFLWERRTIDSIQKNWYV